MERYYDTRALRFYGEKIEGRGFAASAHTPLRGSVDGGRRLDGLRRIKQRVNRVTQKSRIALP